MKIEELLGRLMAVPLLTKQRMIAAYIVAGLADGLQWGMTALLGPLVVGPFDDVIDVLVALILTRLLGFHILLLPTFLIEVVPVADLLPTWLGCTALVIGLRKKEQNFDQLPEAKPPVQTS